MQMTREAQEATGVPLVQVLSCCPTMSRALLACEDIQVRLVADGIVAFKGQDPEPLVRCPFCGEDI